MNPPSPLRFLTLAALLAALSACGGGDSGTPAASTPPAAVAPTPAPVATVDITGLAATGAAIANATVTATNVRGERATALTNAAGNFSLKVPDGAPYLLSVADAAGKAWYSYAQAAGRTNITPLTSLALLQANGNKPLADLQSTWANKQLTAQQVLDAAKVLNANLSTLIQSKGLTPASLNVFNAEFTANGTGLDAVLDAMRVSINCTATSCTQSLTSPSGSVLVNWNANIATNGFSFSWSATSSGTGSTSTGTIDVGIGSCRAPQAGTYSMVVQTTVTGLGSIPIPEICIDGLPAKPSTQADFCASGSTTQQLPPGVQVLTCSFDGTTGVIAARITQPFALDYSIKYSFVKR
jgi:hypothetical protein